MTPAERMPRTAVVIVASTRAAAGVAVDGTGPVITAWLAERGFDVVGPVVVADGLPVADALQRALAGHPSVIVTTGGTGVSPSMRATPTRFVAFAVKHTPPRSSTTPTSSRSTR